MTSGGCLPPHCRPVGPQMWQRWSLSRCVHRPTGIGSSLLPLPVSAPGLSAAVPVPPCRETTARCHGFCNIPHCLSMQCTAAAADTSASLKRVEHIRNCCDSKEVESAIVTPRRIEMKSVHAASPGARTFQKLSSAAKKISVLRFTAVQRTATRVYGFQ